MTDDIKYNFGRKVSDMGPCCEGDDKDEKRTIYPDLYIEGGKDLKDLPDEGLMTIRYKVTKRSEKNLEALKKREYSHEGQSPVCVEMIVMGATEVSEESDEEKEKTEDVVDRIRDEISKED